MMLDQSWYAIPRLLVNLELYIYLFQWSGKFHYTKRVYKQLNQQNRKRGIPLMRKGVCIFTSNIISIKLF